MHSVCVYTTGRYVWLLLKYYLHAFAEEEKLLFSSQQKMSCSVWDGLGVCVSVPLIKKTSLWLQCLASPIRLTKPIKRALSVTSWMLVVVIWNVT